MNEMMEADIQKEIEEMIDTLSAEELDQLEEILSKPLDEKAELQMIQAELEQLGMDPQDVQDMFDLAEMMKRFLMLTLSFSLTMMNTASRIIASSTSLAFPTNLDLWDSWPFTPSSSLLEKLLLMSSLVALLLMKRRLKLLLKLR